MKKCNQIIVAGGAIISCYPGLLLADTCTSLPKCPDLGFSVAKSDLATKCAEKTYLKCPFGDYYFCSDVDDGCPEFVTVNPATEVCTKLCPKNSSKCLEKRTITCQEAVSKVNGRLVRDGNGICGTLTQPIYITGKVNSNCGAGGTAKYVGASIHPASDLAPCKNEMKAEPMFEANYIYVENSARFYVKTKINAINFVSSYSGSVTFGKDAEVRNIEGQANSAWTGNYGITVAGSNDEIINVKIGASCSGCYGGSGSSWNTPTCNFSIGGHNAKVTYQRTYSGSGSCEVKFNCNVFGSNDKCEEGWW